MVCFNPIPSMGTVYFPIYIYHKNQRYISLYTWMVWEWLFDVWWIFVGFTESLL